MKFMSFVSSSRDACRFAGLLVTAALCLLAQEANQTALPGVDLSGLSDVQKTAVSKLLREQGCSCGCNMKVAECRVKDPNCTYSKGLAATIVQAVKSGKSESEAIAAASASRFAHPAANDNRILSDSVEIPTLNAPVLGPANAHVTLVEFSDFQCPYCVAAVPQLHSILKAFPTQVKLIFKQFPLEIHSQAAFAAVASLAAQKQGKFWEMHDALFEHHQDLSHDAVLAIAKDLGLDVKRFEADWQSAAVIGTLKKDMEDGQTAGVEGTPTLFINGQRYNGPIDVAALTPVLEAQLKQNSTAKAAPVGTTRN
jgi:protein-disulfide isomerase